VRSYLSVWRLPSAPVLLVAGFAGRLPSAMVPLALLLMVQQQTGSYAVAGPRGGHLRPGDGRDGAGARPAGRPSHPRPVLLAQAGAFRCC
jgi:hypothetical protein